MLKKIRKALSAPKNQPFEIQEHDLTGRASIDFFDKTDFNTLAQKVISNYNPDRFEPIALRFFVQRKKPTVTFYALDKSRQERSSSPKDKLPVKKFKLVMSFEEFMSHIKNLNLTVTNRAFDLEDMVIINK